MWRPVFAQIATLTEVSEQWSLDDLTEAHTLLNQRDEAMAAAQQSARWD